MVIFKIGKLFIERISYDNYDREFSLSLTSDEINASKYSDSESEIIACMLDSVNIEYNKLFKENEKDGDENGL